MYKVQTFSAHPMCQALRLEGMSKLAERNIENHLRSLFENCGPDYVIDVLKVLKQHSIDCVDEEVHYQHVDGGPSISWNHKHNRPKGPLSTFYTLFPNPIDRIRVIGAAIQAIQLEFATHKQLKKVIESVRCDNNADPYLEISQEMFAAYQHYYLADVYHNKLEKNLVKTLSSYDAFSPVHLTGSFLPYERYSYNISKWKQKLCYSVTGSDHENINRSLAVLSEHWRAQLYTAPEICKTYWNNIVDIAMEKSSSYDIDDPIDTLRIPSKISFKPEHCREYECKLNSHDIDWLDNRLDGSLLCSVSAEYDSKQETAYLGRFDFLQQPGGKLRTIANVNRFVNYTMDPLATALEKQFYSRPNISVTDQNGALRWVQSKLRDSCTLTSLDLTSATDRLSPDSVIDFIYRLSGESDIFEAYLEYFKKLSQLPLYSEDLDCAIQFKTGQPLGMKGSFQMLSIQNYLAGLVACYRCGLSKDEMENAFRVVGDDFICDSRITDEYNNVIESMNGVTNDEKALESDRYGEFLSHIVSASHIYITKPKYRPGNKSIFVNLEKCSKRQAQKIFHLSKPVQEAIELLSEFSVSKTDLRTHLPRLRSYDTSVDPFDKVVMDRSLELLSKFRSLPSDPLTYSVSDITQSLLTLQYWAGVDQKFSPIIFDDNGTVRPADGIHHDVTTYPMTSPSYDHNLGRVSSKPSQSEKFSQIMSLADDISKIKQSLVKSSDLEIDIGFGMSLPVDEITLRAIPSIDYSHQDFSYGEGYLDEDDDIDFSM